MCRREEYLAAVALSENLFASLLFASRQTFRSSCDGVESEFALKLRQELAIPKCFLLIFTFCRANTPLHDIYLENIGA
jgi:hypothetical protein